MSILSFYLRLEIMELMDRGASNEEIFKKVFRRAKPYIESNDQLIRCVRAIRVKHNQQLKPRRAGNEPVLPVAKIFDNSIHKVIINRLRKNMSLKLMEELSYPVVIDILQNYEGFKKIEKGPKFQGTPFDYFGYKNKCPYIIELKSSIELFNLPGGVQKKRLREVLKRVSGLKVALLQVKLKRGEYRLVYHDSMMDFLRSDKGAPINPIVDWVQERI